MSSLQKSFSQIPSRSRLLFAVAGDSGFTQLKLTNAIAANSSAVLQYDGTILNTRDAGAFIGYIDYGRSFATGDLFRDLGKTLHIQTNGRTDYILSYVQQIRAFKSEGVPPNYNENSTTGGNFWICTWNADNANAGIGVNVVRTG
jgi:hypothetical protein